MKTFIIDADEAQAMAELRRLARRAMLLLMWEAMRAKLDVRRAPHGARTPGRAGKRGIVRVDDRFPRAGGVSGTGSLCVTGL